MLVTGLLTLSDYWAVWLNSRGRCQKFLKKPIGPFASPPGGTHPTVTSLRAKSELSEAFRAFGFVVSIRRRPPRGRPDPVGVNFDRGTSVADAQHASADLQGAQKVWALLGISESDPDPLEKVRNDPRGFATLLDVATHDKDLFSVMPAVDCLAIAFPDKPETRSFLFDGLRSGRWRWQHQTYLRALFATYADDKDVAGEIVAVLGESEPGKMADLLNTCLNTPLCIYHPKVREGIPEYVWVQWAFPVSRAPLRMLTRLDLRTLLSNAMKSDPDGPVECVMEAVIRRRDARPWQAPRRGCWRVEETWDKNTLRRQFREERRVRLAGFASEDPDPARREHFRKELESKEQYWRLFPVPDTQPRREQRRIMFYEEPSPEQIAAWEGLASVVRELSEEMAGLHPLLPRAADYLVELDSVGQRRQPGWRRDYGLVDQDLEHRQARVAERLARWPDRAEVRGIFEAMLLDRPAVTIGEPEAGWHFDPLGWRAVAWRTLVASDAPTEDAMALARLLVEGGPWDDEARKSKEAVVAVVKAWPDDERVLAVLAEITSSPIVGDFVRDDIERYRVEARQKIGQLS
jgi:hypothetical protein